jgi:hypothetical protein
MVIIQRVLTNLIAELDENKAQHHALAFAERTLKICADALSATERDVSSAYTSAARDFINGKSTVSHLGAAHHAYFSGRNQNTKLSDEVTWVAALAVRTCCQRQMEDAGILIRVRSLPELRSVAKAAQTIAGRCAAVRGDEPEDGDTAAVARRARWLEAKWQLLYLIESVPFPGEGG